MASNARTAFAVALAAVVLTAHAADPDITSDFVVPAGVVPDANFFTSRGLRRALWDAPEDVPFKVTKASSLEFPALNGQGVSLAALQFAPGAVNPPHIHPRSAELLLVLKGKMRVGFVDSMNKLFTKKIKAGDAFVFPKGMVHFQFVKESDGPTVAISAFGSANAGTISLPKTLFASGIDDEILTKSFKADPQTIEKLVSANMG